MSGSLFDDRYTDPAGRLTRAEAEALMRLLGEYANQGTPAYVVIVPEGEPLTSWRRSWSALSLQDDRDLLILWEGHRWEARGWGLGTDAIVRALDRSEPQLRDGVVPGLEAALSSLRAASPLPDSERRTMEWLVPIGIVFGISGLGWLLARRMGRARQDQSEVERAQTALEEAVASLVISAEALGSDGRALQDRAARLKQELRRVPADEAPYLRVARIRQLEDEVAALSSELLARKRAPSRVPEG